ncbi:Protein kinase-like domain protein [Penicillium mononematosum]|uniref:Protein kinase-like domain protein n=1 Tax=Penicillium mononematosum TaxID=268346 RepID=UPI0025481C7F|nr:Protein kinase-like domain protein [Penicillium mononematosum]KAJ6190415.1 Protein kinase-like domain protein [Penicillium mononematosum]
MSSVPPTEAALQSLRDELKGNIFRNVNGFFAKYFEWKSWSSAVQNKLQETKSADIISKLSAGIPGIAHFDPLVEWLAEFQTLFFSVDQANFRFHSQPLSNMSSTPGAVIYLETSDLQSVAGSTRVFGEFHQDSGSVLSDDDDDTLRFCERAKQVFKAQSARCFVHGFLVRSTTLELWVFDRSGAYSSERLDLAQRPDLLVRTLAGYTLMSDEEAGFNTFVKHAPGSDSYVAFDQSDKLHLRPELIATADYTVGPGTTCYVASTSTVGEPDTAIKFSWREDEEPTEVRLLKRARERNAWGVIQLLGYQDLVNIADLRQGLHFPQTVANRRFSCVASTLLGRPIRQFTSIPELLEVLRDLVKALQSLYVNARILHRDVAIKNLIITPQRSADSPRDLDNVRPIEPMVGSDGFMAIGILSGQRHTYRHDLESLFYAFLWIAIANDGVHDEANDILEGIPKTSRLWKWCTMDFGAVGRDKAADMSPEGFEGILDEFSSDFAPLRGLAKELHALLFPVRDGKVFTGTETDQVAVQRLYDGMVDAFNRSALEFQG